MGILREIRILKAIVSGKSRKEIYGMLSDGEKEQLNALSARFGLDRRARRRLVRDTKNRNDG